MGKNTVSALERAKLDVEKENPDLPMQLRYDVSDSGVIKSLLEVTDLTQDLADESHIINKLFKGICDNLLKNNYKNLIIHRDSPIVSAEDNFDNLIFTSGNPGRSSTYTRYVDEDNVLRTHTSALIPNLFRSYAQRIKAGDSLELPTTIVMPGLVYRRDVIDPRHLDAFHQIDVWTIQETAVSGQVTRNDLLNLIKVIFTAACPEAEIVTYEAKHPYTVDGLEVYAKVGDREVEVLECGLINPEVLRLAGLDENKFCGLALGMGLERLIMAQKELTDIRLIRSTDSRISSQMKDLSKYKPVSSLPPITRDMSYSVAGSSTEEDVCEDIRIAFGDNAYLLEEVVVVERTKHEDLHPIAVQKLGSTPDLDNVLVRIILRHPDITLTKAEANIMYTEAYPKLHKGNAAGYPQ